MKITKVIKKGKKNDENDSFKKQQGRKAVLILL